MKILSISTDRKIFEENSAVRQRIVDYGKLVSELHIIVFSKEFGSERRIISSNIWAYPTNSKNKFFYIWDAIKIGRKILKQNRENWLITTQDPFETGLVGWILAKITKSKLHLQVHTDFMSWKFKMASIMNKTRGQLAMFLIAQADGVRVVSERIKNSIVKWKLKKPERISILPIFVDTQKIEEAESKQNLKNKYSQFDFVILMASRLEKEKNISLAIDVMKKIIKEYPKVGLVIVGDGSQRDSLQKKVYRNRLERNVVFERWQDDLISYYKTADLFLSTSNYEGYGMTLLESAVAGCPILTTDVGLIGEILKEGSIEICKVGKKKCFVEKLEKILESKHLLKIMSEKAKKRCRR